MKRAGKDSRKNVLESIVSNNTKAISQWKDTKVNLYGQYKDGKIIKEEYMAGMEKGKTRLLELEQEIEEAQKELNAMVKIDVKELAKVAAEELGEDFRLGNWIKTGG